jgi:hypothetical protein
MDMQTFQNPLEGELLDVEGGGSPRRPKTFGTHDSTDKPRESTAGGAIGGLFGILNMGGSTMAGLKGMAEGLISTKTSFDPLEADSDFVRPLAVLTSRSGADVSQKYHIHIPLSFLQFLTGSFVNRARHPTTWNTRPTLPHIGF